MSQEKYNVFISFKHSDANGNRSEDSVLAEELYNYLKSRGLKVFFSPSELEFLGQSQYSKVIDDALDSSMFLIAVGCSREHLDSQWVRYEWDSFLNDIRSGTKSNAEVFVLYSGMSVGDLPRALRQRQAFNAKESGSFEKLCNFICNADTDLAVKSGSEPIATKIQPLNAEEFSGKQYNISIDLPDCGAFMNPLTFKSMENYNTGDVQRLAKQGDCNALYEMAWRIELMPSGQGNPVEQCAWQDYWFEKAADAGHIEAKARYARSLRERPPDEEYRKTAMRYFDDVACDFFTGKLNGNEDLLIDGKLSALYLGVMLCEGFYTPRDPEKGDKLIRAVKSLTNGFNGFGFNILFEIGRLYANGFAQNGEEPSVDDLDQAIDYLETAISRYNPENGDPQKLALAKEFLQTQQDRIARKKVLKASIGIESTELPDDEKDTRREKLLTLSYEVKLRMNADKEAVARLRQQLAHEGW